MILIHEMDYQIDDPTNWQARINDRESSWSEYVDKTLNGHNYETFKLDQILENNNGLLKFQFIKRHDPGMGTKYIHTAFITNCERERDFYESISSRQHI